MLIVAFVSFSLFNFVGDPVNNMVGQEASDERREEIKRRGYQKALNQTYRHRMEEVLNIIFNKS